MKKLIVFTVILFAATPNFAQKDREFVVITSLIEKPKELNFLALELPLWHLTGSMVNTSLYDLKTTLSYAGAAPVNGGLTYNARVFDRIMPDSYDRTDYVYQEMVMSKFKTASAQSFEVWGTYFFQDEMKDVKEMIRLKKVGNTIYVTNVDTKQYTRMGVQLGYTQGFTWYNMNNLPIILVDPNTDLSQEFSYNSMTTFQNFKMVKAGICFSKAVNVKVEVDEYGTRTSAHLSTNSFSLLYAIENRFEDVLVGIPNTNTNEEMFLEYQFSDENKRLPIGFEYKHKSYSKGWFSYEYGVGYYPGLMKKINIGVNFGVSVQIDALFGQRL